MQEHDILTRAPQEAEEIIQRARQTANQEAESALARARLEIEAERNQAINEVREQFADLVVLAAGKVIGQSLNKDAHLKIIGQVLEESGISQGNLVQPLAGY